MSWLCWSEDSRLPPSAPGAPGAPDVPGAPGAPVEAPVALASAACAAVCATGLLTREMPPPGPSGEMPPLRTGEEPMPVIGTPNAAPGPLPPRTATAMSGEPGSIFMAVSAPRTSDCARTFLNAPRSGVGVTRGAVVATVTSGRDAMLGESMALLEVVFRIFAGHVPQSADSRPSCVPLANSTQRGQAIRARRARLSAGEGPSSLK